MQGLRLRTTFQVGEDMSALSLQFPPQLLLLSLTDLQAHYKRASYGNLL